MKIIAWTERLNNSASGNPRFRVHFTDGDVMLTKSDASCSFGVENYARSGEPIDITITRAGRIETMQPTKQPHVKIIEVHFLESEISDGDFPRDDVRTDYVEVNSAEELVSVLQQYGTTENAGSWWSDPDGSRIVNYSTGERVETSAHPYNIPEEWEESAALYLSENV
jgi:hypothetical protein